jgi:(p)ppGpp synthase/HD superfamily hydrolase
MLTVMNASLFAAEKHRNQRRKDADKTPYINHPIEVAAELARAGIEDPDVIAAALLHDTVEDTDTSEVELVATFGKDITLLVMECTDDKEMSKVARKKHQIEHSAHISDKGKLVKLADKHSNMKTLFDNPPSKWSQGQILGYVYWTFAVIRPFFNMNAYFKENMSVEFRKFGVDPDAVTTESLNAELEKYYDIIKDMD